MICSRLKVYFEADLAFFKIYEIYLFWSIYSSFEQILFKPITNKRM